MMTTKMNGDFYKVQFNSSNGATPTESTHLATKDYVDSQLSGGGVVTDKIQEGDSKFEVFDTGSDLYFEARLNNNPVMLIQAGPKVTVGNIELSLTDGLENTHKSQT